MKMVKYTEIYEYIKNKILNDEYKAGEKLPSEHELTSLFDVSRNTVRRAINQLSFEGLVASVHGKGVFVLEKQQFKFLVGGLQSFKEASLNNNISYSTKVHCFKEIIIDINYFLKDVIKNLTEDIASNSIYDYLENNINLKIAGAQKIVSVEEVTNLDKKLLNLKGYNLVAIIKNYVYLEDGTLFEYTESRHRPDKFTFSTYAKRL